MTPELSALVVFLVFVLAVLAWDRGCRCEKCLFHTNERRMEALRQAETNHDYEHKGMGFSPNDRDIMSCHDESCPRNPKKEV
jgi:hypothetical protein